MKGTGPALLLAAALAACCSRAPGVGPAAPPRPALRVLPERGTGPADGVPAVRVEIAADPESRSRGLMGRDLLHPDAGMLFVYPEDRELHYWMRGCRIPLAAAFLDAGGRILNVAEMPPGAGIPDGDLRYYDSRGRARFVLEMEGGWFARKGIGPGDLVDLAPALRGVVPR